MSAYTPEQLKAMAQQVIADRNQGGQRSFDLVIRLASRLVMSPNEVYRRIQEFAA